MERDDRADDPSRSIKGKEPCEYSMGSFRRYGAQKYCLQYAPRQPPVTAWAAWITRRTVLTSSLKYFI
jgi:hypothetical protein